MTHFMYNQAITDIQGGSYSFASALKMMLVNSTYTPARSDTVVDASSSSDPKHAEITATNYTRGYGGSGRKTASITVTNDNTGNRAKIVLSNITWSALGGATNDTIVGAILIKEGAVDDTTSKLVAYFDFSPTIPTNGSDITLTMDATNGNIDFNAQ